MFNVICIISGILNLIWKYKMTNKKETSSSWFWSCLDAGLVTFICAYLKMYQLAAFEGFFFIISLLKLSDRIKGLHISVITIVIGIIFGLNTINPLTTIELFSTVLFAIFVYLLINEKKSLAFTALAIGNIGLMYILFEKQAILFLIFQFLSFFLAIRGIINFYKRPTENYMT